MKGRQPYRCPYCGRFIADAELESAVPVGIPSNDPYEPPDDGYAHESCVFVSPSSPTVNP